MLAVACRTTLPHRRRSSPFPTSRAVGHMTGGDDGARCPSCPRVPSWEGGGGGGGRGGGWVVRMRGVIGLARVDGA